MKAFAVSADRAMRFSILAAAALLLGGCSYLFGDDEDEDRLPGERIPVRQVLDDRPASPAVAARLNPLPQPALNRDWTHISGAPSHAMGHLAGPAVLRAAWSADIGDAPDEGSPVTSSPIVLDGVIYTLDAGASVSAFDAASGAQRWRVALAPDEEYERDGFGGGLAAAQGRLFVTTGFGEAISLEAASGEEIWRVRLGAPIRSAPTIAPPVLAVVARDGVGFGLDLNTGRIIWRLQGATSGAASLGGASPAASGDLIIMPFASGEIVAVQATSGRRAWSAVLTGGRRGLARSAITDVTSDPVILGSAVFAGNQSGLLAGFDGRTGGRAWSRAIGSLNPVWPVGQTLYVLTDDAQLMRLSAQTGETLWSRDLPAWTDPDDREGAIAYGGPIVAGGKVLITSSEDQLLSFDAETGEPRGEAEIDGGSITGPIAAGGVIYVLTDSGDLIAFR